MSILDIPHNLNISNITINKKTLYSKSAGTFSKKLKPKKTEKLLKLELPSKFIIFVQNKSMCYIGKNYDQFKNQIIEGKWGYFSSKSKKISVRGVAKNPVDHPNGGRTKTKQPEKSP